MLVDGLVTGYLEAGQGDPVVLLHGGEFGVSAEWAGSTTSPRWRRTTACWHSTCSGSAAPRRSSTSTTAAACGSGTSRGSAMRVGVESAHFVGNSMGAVNMFVDATSEAPLLPARSLVTICGGGEIQRNEHSAALYDYDATLSGMRRIVEALFSRPGVSRPTTRTCSGATSPASRPARGRRWRRPGFGGRVWSRRRCRRARVPTSASPCRRWWSRGSATNYCRRAGRPRSPGRSPSGRSAVVERAGHCPQIEQPGAVNELLLDFLGEVHREGTASSEQRTRRARSRSSPAARRGWAKAWRGGSPPKAPRC